MLADHGSSENGINWPEVYIEYRDLHAVVNEDVDLFAHHYTYGFSKCTFLSGLTRQPIQNI